MTLDVVIIGSGAGGGPLALALAEAGLQVLVLEKGPDYARSQYPNDEIANDRRSFFVPPLSEDPHVLVHESLAAPRPTEMGWIAVCVGGGTAHMGAYLSRFHPDDFRMRRRFGEYESLADWPYSYDELEPYYTRAEWEVGVSGHAGSDPLEGHRSRPYPLPPLAWDDPIVEHLDAACRRRGRRLFPTPYGINSQPYRGRAACEYCLRCPGYGCGVGARASTQEALLPRAVATGRCEIRARTMVRCVTVGEDGTANGCLYLDEEGSEHEVRARVVCVCCSAVESARLLLLSRSPRFPQGLANDSGLVGRNLQFHGTSIGHGTFRRDRYPAACFDHPNPFLVRSLMDHYFLPEGVSDLPKGGLLIFHKAIHEPVRRAKASAQASAPTLWGMELKKRLRKGQNDDLRALSFEVHHDFIPNPGTYVELDPEVQDKWGLPVARIHLQVPEHQTRAGRWLVERGLDVFSEMGAEDVAPVMTGETAPYLVHGTCRAGRDPAASVLNEFCQTHEVPNLFVVDGSFMPTSGGAPPTLTIMANSFRTADHILARFKSGEL